MINQKYHFDITPHIVKQLGEQLVSDEITALLELIKNSFDADATYVSIEINTTGQYTKEKLFYPNHRGFIVVEDDGFGMSENTIMKSWLLISYSQKRELKEAKKKTPGGRTPLGDKGLGRLSTQRLADICEIFTNEEKESGTHIAFNWKDFEKEDALSEVRIQAEHFSSQKIKGTTLILANLNHSEVWDGKNLENFKGQVSQIISPYKENRPFDVYLKINGININLDKSNDELRDLAISRFKFNFDGSSITIQGKTKLSKFIGNNQEDFKNFLEIDNGRKFYDYLSKKQPDIEKSDNSFFIKFEKKFDFKKDIGGLEIFDGERANPGSFNGIIDEFTYDNWMSYDENIKEIFGKLSNYREFAQSQAGIKLFRNGFAVKPFGIDGDDWLRLGDSQTKGSSYYPLRPANVIGYFSIDEGINDKLKDKTDREGLVSNPYSRNFFVLCFFIRDEINRYQEHIRRTYNDFLKTYKTENSGIKTVNQAFSQLKETKLAIEGVWEMDTLIRVSDIITSYNALSTLVSNARRTKINQCLKKIRQIESIKTGGETPFDKTQVLDLRHKELYIKDNIQNSLHYPLSNGDIFNIQGKEYILLVQPCNISLRKDGKRDRNYNIGLLVELETIEKETFQNYKKGQLATVEVIEDVTLPSNLLKVARFSTFQSVSLSPLDLTVFNKEGIAKINLSELDNTSSTIQESWKKRYKELHKIFSEFANGIKVFRKIRVANKDILKYSVFNGSVFTGYKINNEKSLSQRGKLLKFNITRVAHYKSPYSDDLLQKFMLYLSRNAFEHDFTKN